MYSAGSMHRHTKRTFAMIRWAILALCSLAGVSFAAPQSVACALIDLGAMDTLSDGTRVEPGYSAAERVEISQLLASARARIDKTFGAPQARPIVAFRKEPRLFGLPLNAYGSTTFVGSRACVVLGPNGHNLDVVAHELMHAELFDRLGPWSRLTQLPVWFDEGLAMQVDFRPAYELPQSEPSETAFVRRLTTAHQFSAVQTDAQLTHHYAAAKAEVARWLPEVGASSVYSRLERLRQGEPFITALISPALPTDQRR